MVLIAPVPGHCLDFTSRVTSAIGNDVTTDASIGMIVIHNVAAESYSFSYHYVILLAFSLGYFTVKFKLFMF